ncbi:MAG: phage portal protein [Calditrichaeota bacterium]|nr:phage portal protein [Calditrichota bacterium]
MFRKFIDEVLDSHLRVANPKQVQNLIVSAASGTTEWVYSDSEALNKMYEKLVWVYRCVYIIAQNIASLPLKIYEIKKDGTKEDISFDPEFMILQKPNWRQTRFDFWVESLSRLKLQGELFWELDKGDNPRSRKIQALWADWRSENVQVITDPKKGIIKFKRLYKGRWYDYPAENVFFVKYFNPFDEWRGLSPLQSGSSVLNLELQALSYNQKFFKQGMKLSGVLETPTPLDEADAKRLRLRFERLYAGTDKMHKVAVLDGGLKFTPLNTMTLRDAEFSNLRNMNREEIAALFGVPLEVLGVGKSTYANWKEARRSFWQETLLPEIMKIYGLINEFLLPRLTTRQNIVVEPDLSGVEALKEDQETKAKRFFEGFKTAAVTPNDIRSHVYGLDAVDNPLMNTTWLPMALQPIGTVEQGGGKSKKKERNTVMANPRTEEQRTKVWKAIVKKLEPFERQMKRKVKKFFKTQGEEIVARLREANKSVKDGFQIPGNLFDIDEWSQRLTAETIAIITEVMLAAAEIWSGGVVDTATPAFNTALGQRMRKFSKFVNETTKEKLDEVLREAMYENLSLEETVQKIMSEVFDPALTEGRARTIARTEIMGANNAGTQIGLQEGGWERKMWLTSRDEKVRESHQIDGQVVPVDANFVLLDGEEMFFPQDFNERCSHIGTTEPVNI